MKSSKVEDLKTEIQVLEAMMDGYENEDPPDYLYAALNTLKEELQMTQANEVKYPDVHVKLSGKNGNVFVLIGITATAIRRAKGAQAAGNFQKEATGMCHSYDEVLQLIMRTVDVQ